MIIDLLRRLTLGFYLLGALALSGCAAAQSYVILLPQNGETGEVTVTNAKGSQVLNRSWQKTEMGEDVRPSTPVQLNERAVKAELSTVLTALPAPPVRFLLFFPLDSVELTPDSEPLLPEIVKSLKQREPAKISIVGHTDTVGSDAYNERLGRQRAEAILARLRSLGTDPVLVDTVSKGKSEPLVSTPDQTPEPRNRRAEITVW